MPCAACQADKPIKARGLCASCYQRWQKHGTTEYLRWGKQRGVCSVEGCGGEIKARGLCAKHFQRFNKHGHTEQTRGYPDEWGPITTHPLFTQWTWLTSDRRSQARPVVDRWLNSFPDFVNEVGERPSKRHRLYPVDTLQPMGPGNFAWRLPIVPERREGETMAEYQARHVKERRKIYGDSYKDADLRRIYGKDFGLAEYRAMLESQGSVCAVCRQPETAIDRNGNVKMMCVDHDHNDPNGKIRALLCQRCNQALGNIKDNAETARRLAEYLTKHA